MHALKFLSISRCLGEAWRLLAYIADHTPTGALWHWPGVAQIRASRVIKFTLSEFNCVLFWGKRGDLCGKPLTFLYTSPYEHVQYNV